MEQHCPSGKGPFSNADEGDSRKHKRECQRVTLVDIARKKKGGNRSNPATAHRFLLGAALRQAQKPGSDSSASSIRPYITSFGKGNMSVSRHNIPL